MSGGGTVTCGGCLCGAVSYEIHGVLRHVVNCHCSLCRRFHGHYAAYTAVRKEQIVIAGEDSLKWFCTPGGDGRRGFCLVCGSGLFWRIRDSQTLCVSAGSLQQPSGLETIAHIFTHDLADYYRIADAVPKLERGFPLSRVK